MTIGESSTLRDRDLVAIEVPAADRHIALVRTTAVGVVADLDPDLDAVENLRLAVNEAVSLILGSASGGVVRVEFDFDPPALEITVRASEAHGTVDVDELARRILETTTTRYEFLDDGSANLRIDIPDATGGE